MISMPGPSRQSCRESLSSLFAEELAVRHAKGRGSGDKNPVNVVVDGLHSTDSVAASLGKCMGSRNKVKGVVVFLSVIPCIASPGKRSTTSLVKGVLP